MTNLVWPTSVRRHLPEDASQSFKVVSSEALTITELSTDQARSETPALWPVIDHSRQPSETSQILMDLSAEAEASQAPFGENFIEEMARSWP